jgi:hypothetical protein
MSEIFDNDIILKLNKEKEKKAEETLGPKKMRVAVLGAFDTWSLMHKVSVDLARLGYTAVTSRYEYNYADYTNYGYYRVSQPENPDISLNDFLKKSVIGISKKAIIIYTVPAAHYNEADWCMQENIRRMKKDDILETLGIAFVRKITGNYCPDYAVNINMEYGYCNGISNAWFCIEQGNCPFINQEIAKSQIEYFTSESKETMKLICVEKIEHINKIIELYMKGKLEWPTPKPYVYEFRLELTNEQKNQLINKLNILITDYEDEVIKQYKYEDFYYKPKKIDTINWIKGDKTIRIRNHPDRISHSVEVIQSEIIRTDEGFFTKYPYGNVQIWKDDFKSVEKNFLADMSLKHFFYVKKENGLLYKIKNPFDINIYIEKIIIENKNKLKEEVWCTEIEYWFDDIKNEKLAHDKKQIILDLLKIDYKNIINVPIQQHYWIKYKS